ncbi:MAG: hypothetical protein SPJ62_06265 [Inconstantimicrobium porci]|uniref:Uncharacterized protein n=1 Tax=Inconstantimicrobium porci TaxID=2652291 RepID=A0A7X2MWG3_9CLOT|nr:hypothetical protein [Inconstantimicrobium porci]MDY5911603.1 hypothetical protein [Inconstantimicrobium porci]MSR90352.1 hypothetical protein [Inconstantimicrobium porci]
MCPEQNEFCIKLIESLKARTKNGEVEWCNFTEKDYGLFSFLENIIRYSEKCSMNEYPEYAIKLDKSTYCRINYGKNYNKSMIIGLIFAERSRDRDKIIILICSKEDTKEYKVVGDSKKYSELSKLQEIIEFKNVEEFRILDQWMMDE